MLASSVQKTRIAEIGLMFLVAGFDAAAVVVNGYNHRGSVLISGPHPETNQMDFPDLDGPPAAPGSIKAALLQSYVKIACALSEICNATDVV